MNVLMILIDDHRAGLTNVLNAQSPVATPNMRRLAAKGTWFTRAYADAPACCPSRTALLTGMHAASSGVYYNSQAYRRTTRLVGRVESLPGHFRRNGYLTAGYGKIAHQRFLEDDVDDYTVGYYKMLDRDGDVTWSDAKLRQQVIPGSYIRVWSDNWSWGRLSDEWDRDDSAKLQQDTEQANRTIAIVRHPHDRPFFVACGFYRPNVSWTWRERYFDRFPFESITIPPRYLAGDLEDLPKPARWLATHRGEHDYIVKNGLWKKCLQAYYASISYVDEQIGRVLDELEAGPNRDNTIIVFASDNGWHTGEKEHWSKFYLSELACQVVFSISVPGTAPQVCDAPVSLVDIFPTLNRLCTVPRQTRIGLYGPDWTFLLGGSNQDRGRPVLSTYGLGNHSIRDARFRYTRYRNGEEELYDHIHDPNEWTNLAADGEFAEVKTRLAQALPAVNAPDIEFADQDDINKWEDEAFAR